MAFNINGDVVTPLDIIGMSGAAQSALTPSDADYIPIVGIMLDGDLPKTKDAGTVPVTLFYKSNGEMFTDYATIKVQGDSSAMAIFPKKNYTLKLYKDSALSKKDKRQFFDWAATDKFVLKANWIDHSHSRNIVNARLWKQIIKTRSDYDELPAQLRAGHIAIDGFPVRVFSNGVYQGLYTWNLPKDALYGLDDDIDRNALVQGDSAAYSGSILFRADNDDANKWSDETHDTKPEIIRTGWNRVLSFVYTASDQEFAASFTDYFDKQSIIDQYIFLYAGCIVDNLGKNQTFFTYDAVKWYGGMYDLDGTWGCPPFPPKKSTWYDYDTPFQSGYTAVVESGGITNLFYEKVGRVFASDIQTRYAELRAGVLSADNIVMEFDKFMSLIPPYLYEEDYAETTANGEYINVPLKETNNQYQIRPFVVARLAYVDSMIL